MRSEIEECEKFIGANRGDLCLVVGENRYLYVLFILLLYAQPCTQGMGCQRGLYLSVGKIGIYTDCLVSIRC